MNQQIIFSRSCDQHPEQQVVSICIDDQCKANRLACVNCVSKHSYHANQLNDVEKTYQLMSGCNQILKGFNIQIDNLINCMKLMKSIIAKKVNVQEEQIKKDKDSFNKTQCQDHQNEIIMVCTNKDCNQNKFVCKVCISNHHTNHIKNLILKQKFKRIEDQTLEISQIKSNDLQLFIDRLIQKLRDLQLKLIEKYDITWEDFLQLNAKQMSLRISYLSKFISRDYQNTEQTLELFLTIMTELQLCSKSLQYNSNEQDQQNIFGGCQDNFEVILSTWRKMINGNSNQLLCMAEILRMLKKFDQSLYWYDKVLMSNAECKEALKGKGIALNKLGQPEESMQYLEKALTINLQDIDLLFYKGIEIRLKQLGDTLRQLGKDQESIQWFDRVLEINPQNVDSLSQKGDALRLIGKIFESIECFDQVLAINPQYVESLFYKGIALKQLDKNQESIELFDKVLAIYPQNVNSLFQKGVALRNIGENSESIECFDQVLAINPYHVDSLFQKGIALKQLDKNQESIELFDKVLAIHPQNIDLLIQKGDSLKMLGQNQESLMEFKKVLNIDPKNVFVLNSIGIYLIYYFQEKFQNNKDVISYHQISSIRLLILIHPTVLQQNHQENVQECQVNIKNQFNGLISYLMLILKTQFHYFIKEILQEVLVKTMNPLNVLIKCLQSIHKMLYLQFKKEMLQLKIAIIVLRQLGKNEESIECFDKLLALNSEDIDSLISKGEALRMLLDFEQSLKQFNNVLIIDPQNVKALYYQGEILRILNKNEESIDWAESESSFNFVTNALRIYEKYKISLERAEKVLSEEPQNILALNRKGKALNMLCKYQESFECFQKTLLIEPNNNFAIQYFNEELQKFNSYQESIKQWNKILDIDPSNTFVLSSKGRALRVLGQYEESIEWLNQAISIDPQNVFALNCKGDALRMLERYQESIYWFNQALYFDPNDCFAKISRALALLQLGLFG